MAISSHDQQVCFVLGDIIFDEGPNVSYAVLVDLFEDCVNAVGIQCVGAPPPPPAAVVVLVSSYRKDADSIGSPQEGHCVGQCPGSRAAPIPRYSDLSERAIKAVIWLFRKNENGAPRFENELVRQCLMEVVIFRDGNCRHVV